MSFQKLSAIIASYFLSLIAGMPVIIFLSVIFHDEIENDFIYIGIALLVNVFVLLLSYTLLYIPLSIYVKALIGNSIKDSYENLFPIILSPFLAGFIIIICQNPELFQHTETWFWIADIYGIIALSLWLFLNSFIDFNQNKYELPKHLPKS
jgi:hypothetical protein